MNINQLRTSLSNELESQLVLQNFYDIGDIPEQTKRYSRLAEDFFYLFQTNDSDVVVVRGPGRAEFLGGHCDHERDGVIAGAIDDDIVCVAAKNETDFINIYDSKFCLGYTIDLEDLVSVEDAINRPSDKKWKSLLDGVINGFVRRGMPIGGFDMVFHSNVDIGAGVSSSAVLTVGPAKTIDLLFSDNPAEPTPNNTLALICQKSEHEYVRKMCGIMDQSTSLHGGLSYMDFSNPTNPRVTPITKGQFNLEEQQYQILVTNTGESHGDLTNAYNEIGEDMQAVAAKFRKKYLGQIPLPVREKLVRRLYDENKINLRQRNRAIHNAQETIRVNQVRDTLMNPYINNERKMSTLLDAVDKSGRSSKDFLDNLHVPGVPKDDYSKQRLALGYHLGREFLKPIRKPGAINRGANRLMGGGFCGTTFSLVHDDFVGEYTELMEKEFGPESVKVYTIRPGACEIKFD